MVSTAKSTPRMANVAEALGHADQAHPRSATMAIAPIDPTSADMKR
jgi:hypothetical protein